MPDVFRRAALPLLAVLAMPAIAAAAFELKDAQGDHLDVVLDGRTVARYMYAFDASTPERLHETYKPYLHILDAEGKEPITKGPGGLYSHHRGIFCGWKITVAGKTYDFWHIVRDLANAKKVFGKPHFLMLHRRFEDLEAGADRAAFTAVIDWADPDGKTLVQERRTMTLARVPAPALAQVDFATRLKAVAGDTDFGGDPEHAGVQYRPADQVDTKKTVYVFPEGVTDVKQEKDLPWAAVTYVLGGKTYSVLAVNHPDNPKGTVWSAYRDYGRFGAYPVFRVKEGAEQVLRYRFLVLQGGLPPRDDLKKRAEEFAK
jgi:hypothetical protein